MLRGAMRKRDVRRKLSRLKRVIGIIKTFSTMISKKYRPNTSPVKPNISYVDLLKESTRWSKYISKLLNL